MRLESIVIALLGLSTTSCGAAGLAMQRSNAAQQVNSEVTCVRADEQYAYDDELEVDVGNQKIGGRAKGSFEFKESARARCLREAARVQFQTCVAYANGVITKQQYRDKLASEAARCDAI